MSEWTIRPEQSCDIAAIRTLTAAAFAGNPHSDGSEPDIIDALRADGDLVLSLVAHGDGLVLGHIAFSPVTISDGAHGWYGLGPVSVAPERQGEGIGSALINYGLGLLRQNGARGVVLLGNPDYYGRFGFAHDPQLAYPGPPPEFFQRLVLSGDAPAGIVTYARGFG